MLNSHVITECYIWCTNVGLIPSLLRETVFLGTLHFHVQNVFCCIELKELGDRGYKDYGPVFRVWLTVVPIVVLLQPEHLQVRTNTSITVSSKYPCHYAANEVFFCVVKQAGIL